MREAVKGRKKRAISDVKEYKGRQESLQTTAEADSSFLNRARSGNQTSHRTPISSSYSLSNEFIVLQRNSIDKSINYISTFRQH